MNAVLINAQIKAIINSHSPACECKQEQCELCNANSMFNHLKKDLVDYLNKLNNETGKHHNS